MHYVTPWKDCVVNVEPSLSVAVVSSFLHEEIAVVGYQTRAAAFSLRACVCSMDTGRKGFSVPVNRLILETCSLVFDQAAPRRGALFLHSYFGMD